MKNFKLLMAFALFSTVAMNASEDTPAVVEKTLQETEAPVVTKSLVARENVMNAQAKLNKYTDLYTRVKALKKEGSEFSDLSDDKKTEAKKQQLEKTHEDLQKEARTLFQDDSINLLDVEAALPGEIDKANKQLEEAKSGYPISSMIDANARLAGQAIVNHKLITTAVVVVVAVGGYFAYDYSVKAKKAAKKAAEEKAAEQAAQTEEEAVQA